MKLVFSGCIAMLCTIALYAQHPYRIIITGKEAKPLQGATASIHAINQSAIADSNGVIIFKKCTLRHL